MPLVPKNLTTDTFITKNYTETIKTSIYADIILALKKDQSTIKRAIAKKTPLDSNISELIKELEDQVKTLRDEQSILPKKIKSFGDAKEKYIFIGETKAKLDLYAKSDTKVDDSRVARVKRLEEQLADLHVENVEERREMFVKVLDEAIQEFIGQTSPALENYGVYKSSFNYNEKKLQLRKPKSHYIEHVGSSSNHMFLHLFLFLGLHEIILDFNVEHVPPVLIIDQFSRPYWGKEGKVKKELSSSDSAKVTVALTLLNDFMQTVNDNEKSFQMIIFEHIEETMWTGMDHIHLVEKFEGGNALIPNDFLD